jgi:hypothetical protein
MRHHGLGVPVRPQVLHRAIPLSPVRLSSLQSAGKNKATARAAKVQHLGREIASSLRSSQ